MATTPLPVSSKILYDLIVVGGGSGGIRAARISATHGAKVALVETSLKHGPPNYTAIGGTCVNVGCVPKKLMVLGSHFANDFETAKGFGWTTPNGEPQFHWETLMEHKNKEITRLNGAYGKILANAGKEGVHLIEGHGSLLDKNTVEVRSSTGEKVVLQGKNVLIAVGGWPHIPGEVKGAREHAITSNEAFYLPRLPKRMLIVGGGYIAVEFACIFKGLGVDVTQIYRGPMFLRGFDDDVRKFLHSEMTKKGIKVVLEDDPVSISSVAQDGGKIYEVATKKGQTLGGLDCVMYATGRRPKLEGLGLEKVGVKVGPAGQIVTDEWSRTNVENVYAIGDCTDKMQLTPVALREGHLLADALFTDRKRKVDYELVPSTVFTQPEIGTVGLTEAAAVAKHRNVTVYTTTFKAMKHTMTTSTEKTFMKLIVEEAGNKVVGLHMVGDYAGEIVQGFAVAMRAGATKADFDDTIGIHPTSAEEFVTMRTPSYRYVNGTKL